MAMRAATMNSMSQYDTPPTVRETDSLFRKLVLLVLLISAASLWIGLMFKQAVGFPLLLSTFFTDASLGLIAGFGSRFVLGRRHWFVRYFVAILIAVTGMIMIGSLTRSVLGIGPIRLEREFARDVQQIEFNADLGNQIRALQIGSRTLFDFSRMNWADPLHLAVTLVMTVLSLQAWRRTAPAYQSGEPVEIVPLPSPAPASRSRRVRRTASSNRRGHVQQPRSWFNGLRPSPQPQTRTNGSRARGGVKKAKDSVVRPKRKSLFQRKPHIQFALVEEHRCPYCLDIVTRNDPRGVKECEVCHTLHHADCWAITGVCQVPHLNT